MKPLHRFLPGEVIAYNHRRNGSISNGIGHSGRDGLVYGVIVSDCRDEFGCLGTLRIRTSPYGNGDEISRLSTDVYSFRSGVGHTRDHRHHRQHITVDIDEKANIDGDGDGDGDGHGHGDGIESAAAIVSAVSELLERANLPKLGTSESSLLQSVLSLRKQLQQTQEGLQSTQSLLDQSHHELDDLKSSFQVGPTSGYRHLHPHPIPPLLYSVQFVR